MRSNVLGMQEPTQDQFIPLHGVPAKDKAVVLKNEDVMLETIIKRCEEMGAQFQERVESFTDFFSGQSDKS